MAWFGSGISQITGQISNFTKEVLTEGTEEVDGRCVMSKPLTPDMGLVDTSV